jgi:hypothetical protein
MRNPIIGSRYKPRALFKLVKPRSRPTKHRVPNQIPLKKEHQVHLFAPQNDCQVQYVSPRFTYEQRICTANQVKQGITSMSLKRVEMKATLLWLEPRKRPKALAVMRMLASRMIRVK